MPRHPPEWWCDTEDLKTEIRHHTIRGGQVVAISQTARSLLELGSTLLLARVLAPEHFGVVGMALAFTGFIGLFKDMGLSTATIQSSTITARQVSQLFWINALFSGALALLIVLSAPLIAAYYRESALTPIVRVLGLTFMIDGLSIQHMALLRRRMLFARAAVVDLLGTVAGLGSAIALALSDYGPWALVYKLPIGASVTALGAWIACDFRPELSARVGEVRALLGFGSNLTGFSLINYLARNVDNMLIGRYYGAHALGLYQKAYDLLMLPLRQINTPVSEVAIPSLSRLYDDPERYRRAFLAMFEKVLLLTMPLGAFLMAASDWIIILVLGPAWGEAGPIFFWMGMLTFTQPAANATGWLFISQNRGKEMLRWGFLGAGLAIASFLAGLPWGPIGVAFAYSVSGILIRTPILLWMVGRTGPVGGFTLLRASLPSLGAALVGLAIAWAARHLLESRFGALAPWTGAILALALTALGTIGALLPFAHGRRALRELMTLASTRRRASPDDGPA
ncbi:MAG TPA: lipopolysaccharide biosynthesis protein [Polyangiaceae bacterium]